MGGITRNIIGQKEKWVTKKENKGDLTNKKSSSTSTIMGKQQKIVVRPDTKRIFIMKAPMNETGKKLCSGGPEPFIFGQGQENDMDFSDEEGGEAPELMELDGESGEEEEDMDDLEMLS